MVKRILAQAYLCEALFGGNRGRALFTTDQAHCLETTPTILKKPETSHLSNLSFAKTIITRTWRHSATEGEWLN